MFLIALRPDCTGDIIWVIFLALTFAQDAYGVDSTGNPTENDGIDNCCSIYETDIDITKLF